MGGSGSGRTHSTAKIDEGLKLDINRLKRQGLLHARGFTSGSLEWTYTGTSESAGSISIRTDTLHEHNKYIELSYNHTPYYSDESESIKYRIPIITTPAHFGGKRMWFQCPFTSRRCSTLYKSAGSKYFASRHAYKHLKYQSQSRCPHNRAIDKMWKLKRRLNEDGDYWLKPKGMHWKTFHRLCDEIEEAEEVCSGYLAQYFMNKFETLGGLL